MLVDLGYTERLEEVKGWAEPVLDATGEQSGPSVDDPLEIRAVDAGLADEEGENRSHVGDFKGEKLRAHPDDAAELDGGEVESGDDVIDGGFEVGERGGEDRRVVID